MALTRQQTKHIADLARLALKDDELELYAHQLSSILDYAARLEAIDTDQISPTATVLSLHTVTRPDELKPVLDRAELLRRSADSKDGMFRVSAAIGGADE